MNARLSPLGLIKLGSALRELGVELTPKNYGQVLRVLGLPQVPEQLLQALDESYYTKLDTMTLTMSTPTPTTPKVQKEEPKVAPAVKVEVDTSGLFDF